MNLLVVIKYKIVAKSVIIQLLTFRVLDLSSDIVWFNAFYQACLVLIGTLAE